MGLMIACFRWSGNTPVESDTFRILVTPGTKVGRLFFTYIKKILFAKNNFLNITDMYTLELGVFMYKFYINDLPVAFNDYFKNRSDIHDYPTRQINNLTLSLNRKSFSDHAIRTSGPHLWNSLPEKLKDSKTVKQFRNQLKETLIKTYE